MLERFMMGVDKGAFLRSSIQRMDVERRITVFS